MVETLTNMQSTLKQLCTTLGAASGVAALSNGVILAAYPTEIFSAATAEQALRENTLVEQRQDALVLVYAPLPENGVLGLHIPADTYTPKDAAIIKLFATHLRSEARLLSLFESLPSLEHLRDTAHLLEHINHIFEMLGWSAVRITLNGVDNLEPRQYISSQNPLPPIPLPDWQLLLENTALNMGAVHYLPDLLPQHHTLLIPVRTSAGVVAAIIELYQANSAPTPSLDNIRPVLIVARQFGNLLEHSLLTHSLRQTADLLAEQVDELEFIRRADREISSRLDPNYIVNFTLDWALRRSAADAGAVIVVEPGTRQLIVREALGYPHKELMEQQASQNFGIVNRAIRDRTRQLIKDVQQDPDYVQLLPRTVTKLVIPLVSHKRVVGALALESKNPNQFDDGMISFLERITGMTAIALDNAQLLQQAEQLADDMSLIYSGGRTISASLEWEEAIQSIAQGMALAVKNSSALVYRYDKTSRQARLLSAYTNRSEDNQKHLTQALPAISSVWDITTYPAILHSIDHNQMLTLNTQSPPSPETEWLHGFGTDVAGITPLTAQGEPVGLAVLLKLEQGKDFAASEIFVAESLASQAAAVLRQASLYAEVRELESLKSQMIRMASHDLRAPIANAMGYLDLVELDIADVMTEDLQSYVDSIKRSVQSMETMVEDLLTLERIESQHDQAWTTFNLDELVSEVFEEQYATANLKQQTLSLLLPETTPLPLRGNQVQLRQGVMNLISNGLKYTPEGGKIEARVWVHADRTYFEVADNGYGIPAERQHRIFERFYRAKTAGTEHIRGTGLGLSLVKTIIERHGGEITFKSEEGKGSTFTFWLPYPKDER